MADAYEAKVTAYNAKAEAVKASRTTLWKLRARTARYDERDLSDPKRRSHDE